MAKAKPEELRVEYVPLDEVVKWPRNPRQHDDAAIERSLKRYGFVSPLLKDERTGKLVAGHGRLGSLESLRDAGEPPPKRIKVDKAGRWLVPVVCGISFGSAAEAEAYLVADNRIAEIGGWDMDGLREIVSTLSDEGLELDALGWSEKALETLLSAEEPAKKRKGAAPDDKGLAGVSKAKAISLYFDVEVYEDVLDRMRTLMDSQRLPDHSALLLFLLDHYEAGAPTSKPGDPFAPAA